MPKDAFKTVSVETFYHTYSTKCIVRVAPSRSRLQISAFGRNFSLLRFFQSFLFSAESLLICKSHLIVLPHVLNQYSIERIGLHGLATATLRIVQWPSKYVTSEHSDCIDAKQ